MYFKDFFLFSRHTYVHVHINQISPPSYFLAVGTLEAITTTIRPTYLDESERAEDCAITFLGTTWGHEAKYGGGGLG